MPTHDVNTTRIAGAGLAIALGVALAVAAVFMLLGAWHTAPGADNVRADYLPDIPNPALQSAPQLDMDKYREEKRRLLDSSGWVDARQGIVHVPISTAMDLLVAQSAASSASSAKGRP